MEPGFRSDYGRRTYGRRIADPHHPGELGRYCAPSTVWPLHPPYRAGSGPLYTPAANNVLFGAVSKLFSARNRKLFFSIGLQRFR
jgi:hypothetical protein